MSRQIKFRVWDLDRKIFLDLDKENPPLILKHGLLHGYLKHPEFNFYYNPNYVIQQFTGCLDQKGKEIYEGDILQIEQNYRENGNPVYYHGKVYYSIDRFVIESKYDKYHNLNLFSEYSEIVGNMFENPELL